MIGDDSVELTFKAAFSKPLSESPKGTLSVDQARVAIGAPIDFTVDLDATTVSYAVIGYNVTASSSIAGATTKPCSPSGSHGHDRHDQGDLQVDAGSGRRRQLRVRGLRQHRDPALALAGDRAELGSEGGGELLQRRHPRDRSGRPRMQAASARRVGPQATTCADTWVGTTTSGDAAYGPNQTEATLTLKVDDRVTGLGPGQVFYYAEGTLKVNGRVTDLNGVHCEYLPFEIVSIAIPAATRRGTRRSNQFSVNYSESPPTAGGAGVATGTQTIVCTAGTSTTSTITNGYAFMSAPQGVLNADRLSWSASRQPFLFVQLYAPVARQRRVRDRAGALPVPASRMADLSAGPPRPAPGRAAAAWRAALRVAANAAVPLEASDADARLPLLEGPTSRQAGDPCCGPTPTRAGRANSLRQRLLRLRKSVGAEIVTGRTQLAIAAHVTHDASGDAELLASIAPEQAGGLGEWLDAARSTRRHSRLEALAAEASRLEAEQRIADALVIAHQLVAADRVSEHAHRRVMRLHYLRGDRAAAWPHSPIARRRCSASSAPRLRMRRCS